MGEGGVGTKERFSQVVRLFRRGITQERPHPDLTPGCPFGAVLEQRLRDLEQNFVELRNRVYGLLFLVLGSVVLEIVLRLVHWPG